MRDVGNAANQLGRRRRTHLSQDSWSCRTIRRLPRFSALTHPTSPFGNAHFTGTQFQRGNVNHNGPLLDADGTGNIDIAGDLVITNGSFTSVVGSGTASYRDVSTSGNQSYTGNTSLAGEYSAANYSFGNLFVRDDVTLVSTTGRFDFNGAVTSTAQPVLNVLPPFGTDIFIDSTRDVGHIRHNAFTGFDGTLVIGGRYADRGGSLLDGEFFAVTADYIRVSEDFRTGGNLLLVGSTIEFAGSGLEIAAGGPGGGELVFLALGDNVVGVTNDGIRGGVGLGNISAPSNGTVTVTGGQATFATTRELENSNNIILNLGRGPVAVAQSDTAANQQVTFNVRSNASESGLDLTRTGLVTSLVTNNIVTFRTPGALFQNARVSFPNPAAVLTILQAVSFVDASLFEEDLSLFGVIGNGIALSLDQCEDAEGCAPAVTEEELGALIATLTERIARLESLLAAGEIAADEAARLLDGYRDQLDNFLSSAGAPRLPRSARKPTNSRRLRDEFDDVFEAEEVLEPARGQPGPLDEPMLEDSPPELDTAEEFEALDAEPAVPAEDVDEAEEFFEAPAPDAPADEPGFEELDDEFEDLDDALIRRELGARRSAARRDRSGRSGRRDRASSIRVADPGTTLLSVPMTAARLPLFYRQVMPLSRERHRDWYIDPDQGYACRAHEPVYVAASESRRRCPRVRPGLRARRGGRSGSQRAARPARRRESHGRCSRRLDRALRSAYVRRYPCVLAAANPAAGEFTCVSTRPIPASTRPARANRC